MDIIECYQILGVQAGASQKEIKNAYRKLSLKHHPDRNWEDDGEKFKKITEAYQYLRNVEKNREKISENDVATKYSDFWKKHENDSDSRFDFGKNFTRFDFGANFREEYDHNQEKEKSPITTHIAIYGGLGAIALWIILSNIFK